MTKAPGRRESQPRWLVGPWTRWVRDWADLIRLSFLVAGCVLLVQGDVANALRLFLTFAVAVVPRLIGTPLRFDLAFGIALSLQAWGTSAASSGRGTSTTTSSTSC